MLRKSSSEQAFVDRVGQWSKATTRVSQVLTRHRDQLFCTSGTNKSNWRLTWEPARQYVSSDPHTDDRPLGPVRARNVRTPLISYRRSTSTTNLPAFHTSASQSVDLYAAPQIARQRLAHSNLSPVRSEADSASQVVVRSGSSGANLVTLAPQALYAHHVCPFLA